MSACRSCGAPVVYVPTVAGTTLILDEDPVPNGNIEIRDGKARVLHKDELAQATFDPRILYVSHFATCPDSAQWRRRK
jgi:hypothetical protein